MRRIGCRGRSSESCATPCWTALRCVTTGDQHSYKPGRFAKALRSLFVALTPTSLKKRIAIRMQSGMERAEELEKEQQWLKKHGSPLRVMGLPDHAELTEIRARYRTLVLETHPDTATTAAGESEYAILQTAYGMSTNPVSLWHQNGSSPVLYRQLLAASRQKVRRLDRVRLFAIFSYAVMLLLVLFFSVVVVTNALEAALQFFDPEFYRFMIQQEKEEERKRMAGEYVDTDPKRLAPTAVRRLLFPGQFIHDGAERKSGGD
ncbi:putative mitochondrial chaperone protein DNAj [Leptomonas pyrrhocoris]|uniref:Putative mitochondrial chaperone protein DNAj n=1 Tax=Leptomonas pyrrhocoris TaxID=157538 RepID=A0A0N0VCM5_LEPPY|nr:putative mitochondrial chaperone protein DNAj [Leptomonas pyrrhocoris]KPA73121.1 putative mitochondrial chaperone protein DNAj [Leptomonas pyrrhocoris]|eukprot:XP_015651560.1 putative mitochondrial chaperone protein DNAj [Leptomonas pyrrhocoris]